MSKHDPQATYLVLPALRRSDRLAWQAVAVDGDALLREEVLRRVNKLLAWRQ